MTHFKAIYGHRVENGTIPFLRGTSFKLALCLLFVGLISGCASQKRCFEKFHILSDTVKTVIYRDTIIPVYVPAVDTVYQFGNIIDTVFASSGSAHAITYVLHDTLKLYVWQSDTTLQTKLDSVIKELIIEKGHVVTLVEKPKIYKILWQIIAGLGIVTLIVLIPRMLKKK